jgi:hypothetical protein
MRISTAILGALFALASGLGAVSAQAEMLAFSAALDGKYGEQPTGSDATGTARVKVDTKRQLVSLDLTLDGITAEALWDKLVAAPIGPIHFHKYATAAGGESVLVLPVPYGASYRPTKRGLRVTVKDYDYRAGAKLLNSELTFDEFVAALRSGLVVLNIHTDAFNPGEISGRIEKS